MSSDDEQPPKELLKPIHHFQITQPTLLPSSMASNTSTINKKPYQITFTSRSDEQEYTRKLRENCETFNGDADKLLSWLTNTGNFLATKAYPETDHPFIIRHLLTDDALDYYLAHEDLIFNFYDLRKLFLHKHNLLIYLRTISTLDSIGTLSLSTIPSVLTSTQLPSTSTTTKDPPPATTTFNFSQSLDDLTQNDIRKTIIEDLQKNTPKFTGEHRQDVIKWLKNVTNKFETAGIPDIKKFDFISQLLDKGALDWFYEHKEKLNHSWTDFVDLFKRTFDSPNRARIAMQKLHSYTQSPQQDVRSFCSEMRKLFLEADSQMSSTMKLELLLAKVHPSYRLDLLKQKPKDADEFETMARDLENTFLVLDAIEQNAQSFTTSTSSPAGLSPTAGAAASFQRTSTLSSYSSPRSNYRSFNSPRSYQSNPSPTTVVRPTDPSQSMFVGQPFTPRYGRGYNNRRQSTPRQTLFTYQPATTSLPLIPSPVVVNNPYPLMSLPNSHISPPPSSSSSTSTSTSFLSARNTHPPVELFQLHLHLIHQYHIKLLSVVNFALP